MGITKVSKRISTTVEEDRYTCDYCGVIAENTAMPRGWGWLKVFLEDNLFPTERIVCSKCIGNLGKTVVEVAAEKAMLMEAIEPIAIK